MISIDHKLDNFKEMKFINSLNCSDNLDKYIIKRSKIIHKWASTIVSWKIPKNLKMSFIYDDSSSRESSDEEIMLYIMHQLKMLL